MLFTEMNISPQVIRALDEQQIISPTEIQAKSIPLGLASHKTPIIGQAKTGSGKTLAFAIPMIEGINAQNFSIQAVILVPTRELCKQNASVLRSLTKYKKIRLVEIYGGASYRNQVEQINSGAQIVIATPGRLIDLVRRGAIRFHGVKFVALDEADRMLDMGFLPDIKFLLLDAMKSISPRLFLFSATMMPEIKQVIQKFTKSNEIREINVSQDSLTVENCQQYAFPSDNNKFNDFIRVLNAEQPEFSIIFIRTKRNAEKIAKRLRRESQLQVGMRIGLVHGGLSQAKREETVDLFRQKKLNCLVGTNVLARGLDFKRVSHVFNYDLPRDPEDYVHRIGRAARTSGKDKKVEPGKAISMITPETRVLFKNIEKMLHYNIERRKLPPASYPSRKSPKPSTKRESYGKPKGGFSQKKDDSGPNQPRSSQHSKKGGRTPQRHPKRGDHSKNSAKHPPKSKPKQKNRGTHAPKRKTARRPYPKYMITRN